MDNSEFATKADLNELGKGLREEIQNHTDTILKRFDEHIGALYEKSSDDVKVVAELHQETNRRLSSLEEKVGVIGQTVDTIEDKVVMIEQKLDDVVEAVGEIKTDFSKTKEDVAKLQTRVSFLEAK